MNLITLRRFKYLEIVVITVYFVAGNLKVYGCPGNHGSNLHHHGNSSIKDDDSILLSPEELDRQISDMYTFLTVQMEKPGGWDSTDMTTKFNASDYGIPNMGIFRQIFTGAEDDIKRDTVCAACQVYIGLLMYQINRKNESRENLEIFVIFTCRFFRLAHPDVCDGLVHRLGPTFYWIVKSRRSTLSPHEFCGVTLQSLGCRISKKKYQNSEFNWELEPVQHSQFPRPPHNHNTDKVTDSEEVVVEQPDPSDNVETFTPLSVLKQGNRRKNVLKILHLADLHIDLDYFPGTKTKCDNEILCCQKRFGYPNETEVGAGYYGDNGICDAPMKMLHLTLSQIKRQHSDDIDLIYMTGDLVPHNIWYSERYENEHIISVVSRVLFDYFPNTKLIPCLGNHEAHPVNLFSPTSRSFEDREGGGSNNPIPEDLRQDWVYDTAYLAWEQWIPSGEREKFLHAGYFSVEINDKLRVLVINTNVCYGFNMWQTYEPRDPGNMLQWLQNELHDTEKGGKSVHLVGHVPPGHEDCSKTWSREFYKIVARYRATIKGQFYGHTHYDEFRILHDPETKREAINVLWIAPSVTPYRIFNPGYRIYHMDAAGRSSTYGDIVDHETWIFDLDKANEAFKDVHGDNGGGDYQTSPQEDREFAPWFKYYQATEVYGMEDVRPKTLRSFVSRMARDNSTFELFYQHFYKATNKKFLEEHPCDTLCKKRILCGIVRSYFDDDDGHQECNNVQREVDGVALPLKTLEQKRRWIWL